jgi:hypothetical protein
VLQRLAWISARFRNSNTSDDVMNFKTGLSIWEWDFSLLVVKRDLLLAVAIQLNAFSGPALEATDVIVVDDSCGPWSSDWSRSFSREEDDSALFVFNDDAIVRIPP